MFCLIRHVFAGMPFFLGDAPVVAAGAFGWVGAWVVVTTVVFVRRVLRLLLKLQGMWPITNMSVCKRLGGMWMVAWRTTLLPAHAVRAVCGGLVFLFGLLQWARFLHNRPLA